MVNSELTGTFPPIVRFGLNFTKVTPPCTSPTSKIGSF